MNGDTVDHESVSAYYSKTLKTSEDLATNACCSIPPPSQIIPLIRNIHDDVIAKYYGCGLCLPLDDLTGLTILDLGCGAGRDVYIASQLVGPEGRVIGVDMTREQLDVAIATKEHHREVFGFSNVEFYQGYLEKLDEIVQLEDNSVDVIISNCVINLCMDKRVVLESCHRLLKPGGEVYFSDVYSDRRVPESLRRDEVLWGECLSGALYWNDFENLAKRAGFLDPRLFEDGKITVENDQVLKKTRAHGIEFYSATYRLFKIQELEPACEDYGQAVVYKGSIPNNLGRYMLDGHHYMEKGKVFLVCGNTYRMLHDTRLKRHFDFIGNWDKHYGIFEGCGTVLPYKSAGGDQANCC